MLRPARLRAFASQRAGSRLRSTSRGPRVDGRRVSVVRRRRSETSETLSGQRLGVRGPFPNNLYNWRREDACNLAASAYPTVCHRTPRTSVDAFRGCIRGRAVSVAGKAEAIPRLSHSTPHACRGACRGLALAGGRAGGAVRIKNEKTFIHDGSRDTGATELSAPTPVETRARTARTRAGGGAVLYPTPRFEPIPRHALVCRTRRNRCSESLLG